MAITCITENVWECGAKHWDRRLFDELIPLPEGTTYNAYFIKGKNKSVLIDTVDPTQELVPRKNLNELQVHSLDYIVCNHAEQDHSGCIPAVLSWFPMAHVVTNAKCKEMLKDHLLIPDEKFIVINDRDTLELGDKTIEFIFTPWVHWPETMVTYLREDKILFSCDFFGSHLATADPYAQEESLVYFSAKRYYAEIMMPFRNSIKSHFDKLAKYDFSLIAPSHGPIYQKPDFILTAYRNWISDIPFKEVIIPYVSMHGSTRALVDYFVNALQKRNIIVKPFNLTVMDIGELAMALVDASTVVLGTPTTLTGPHPAAVYATYLMNLLRPKTKFVSLIGSFGWGTRIQDVITNMISNLKVEILQPVIVKGYPKESDFKLLDALADTVLQKHSAF